MTRGSIGPNGLLLRQRLAREGALNPVPYLHHLSTTWQHLQPGDFQRGLTFFRKVLFTVECEHEIGSGGRFHTPGDHDACVRYPKAATVSQEENTYVLNLPVTQEALGSSPVAPGI